MGLLIGYDASKVTLSADIIDVSRIKAGVERGTAMPSDGSMNTGRGQIQLIICSHFSLQMNITIPTFTLAQPATSRAEAMRPILYGIRCL